LTLDFQGAEGDDKTMRKLLRRISSFSFLLMTSSVRFAPKLPKTRVLEARVFRAETFRAGDNIDRLVFGR
jgi:hypothetical protein